MNKDNKKQEENLEMLIKRNLAVSQEILEISKYIKKYVFWRKIIGIINILIILIPIILGIIYLPPIIERGLDNIGSSLNFSQPLVDLTNNGQENGQ